MTVYRYVRTGRLAGTQDGNRWLVEASDVAQLLPGRPAAGAASSGASPTYRSRLRQVLLAGDEPGAWRVVESAMSSGNTPENVLLDVLAPVMRQIGDDWACGMLTVGDEHRATAVAVRLVGRLGPLCIRRGLTRGTVVVACVPGNTHTLPAAILVTVLRGAGYAVVDLGGDTPAATTAAAAAQAGDRLRAVCISVGSRDLLCAAKDVAACLRDVPTPAPVLIGGPPITSAAEAESLGADGWAPDAAGVVAVLDRWRKESG